MSLLHQDAALYLLGIIQIIDREYKANVERLADMSNSEDMRATGLSAGTFRKRLLTTRRHHKRPQNAVIHLRCIMTGGQFHPQLPRGRVSGSNSVCKAGTFACHRPANGEVGAWGLSDGALIPEQRQLVRELTLGSRRCRVTGSSASVRPCDVLSRVPHCLNLVIHKAPRTYEEERICRTYSRLRECLTSNNE